MMPHTMADCDVAVVGAGVAGLTVTEQLARAGLRVLCIEARDRIGGRIFTLHDPLAPVPMELGAEFVHGRPAEIWEIVRAGRFTAYDCGQTSRRIRDGVVQDEPDSWDEIEHVMEEMERTAEEREESFAAFLARSSYSDEVKELATGYVEGFNAARSEIVGIRSLAKDARASDEIDGDRAFRLLSGYDAVPLHLFRNIGRQVRLNTVLEEVVWRARHVELRCVHGVTGERFAVTAKKAVFTLPLGVLQSDAIRWSPAPKAKLEAARALAFGQVARVILRFREPFWEERNEFADTGFFFSNNELFPTWWTTLAVRAPILTGWSAGPHADTLLGQSREQVLKAAAGALAEIFDCKISDISAQLERSYFHDWHADPFARGAYSYVPANAESAREHLAAAVEDTLFFAGEATEWNGHSATVHGAIASGMRAAKEITR